jgi:hypothetical protein
MTRSWPRATMDEHCRGSKSCLVVIDGSRYLASLCTRRPASEDIPAPGSGNGTSPTRRRTAAPCLPHLIPDLVDAVLDWIDGVRGIWHLANQGAITWFEFGFSCRWDKGSSYLSLRTDPGGPAAAYSVLCSERACCCRRSPSRSTLTAPHDGTAC